MPPTSPGHLTAELISDVYRRGFGCRRPTDPISSAPPYPSSVGGSALRCVQTNIRPCGEINFRPRRQTTICLDRLFIIGGPRRIAKGSSSPQGSSSTPSSPGGLIDAHSNPPCTAGSERRKAAVDKRAENKQSLPPSLFYQEQNRPSRRKMWRNVKNARVASNPFVFTLSC